MHQLNTINNLKILNSREVKHIVEIIKEQYNSDVDLSQYVFLSNKDNRINIVSRNIEWIPYNEMKIDSLGMYLGEIYKESLRLSIEGSQLIGPTSKTNVVEISKDQMSNWAKGSDLNIEEINGDLSNTAEDNHSKKHHFLIIKYNDGNSMDYFGAGKFKDGKILNFVSKSRRLVTVNE